MPSDPVFAVRAWAVSRLVAVTVAFGTTAPEGSVTVPVSDPVEAVWPIRDGTDSTNPIRTIRKRTHPLLLLSFIGSPDKDRPCELYSREWKQVRLLPLGFRCSLASNSFVLPPGCSFRRPISNRTGCAADHPTLAQGWPNPVC